MSDILNEGASSSEIIPRWVAALRSGEYTQGRGALRSISGAKYCCLGVLCDLIAPQDWHHDIDGWSHTDNQRSLPAPSIREAAGLSTVFASLLAKHNDQDGWTFAQIADAIEAEYALPRAPEGWSHV